ncbi:cysteine--tRNA ligase [Paraburkholderia phymatum]|uniref:Cysteine--tRNA ligase n=1 Tax=Paraburkholderia phymatum (strain DSM 17167 / CIP 108236 / LMG 21445 / STM815) TaxID=391038 RepID=B2JT14_PARP8|nr:cysteine--tRNA ligase [Paraburkholderia phymatum]ACC75717.1 cysteinyl-tRNA synthetase [Paraburkholderia phymatum STM815]
MPPLMLYDTWSRALRPFVSIEAGRAGMYCCGPTVYDHAHIGNLRTYVFEDVLRRALVRNGYQLRHVVNITDVGHLVSDADEGEDKMEKGSRRTGESAWTIASRYTDAFVSDWRALNLLEPSIWCRATDHIAEQIAFIVELERGGYVYRTDDGLYFDTGKQHSYGYLARLDRAGLQAGKRVALGAKKNITDFALWKFSPVDVKRQMEWDSPWGRGFPGWHIECSAMSAKYLGTSFDIHCGGEDHIAVHHSNEIAQTEAAYGTRLANFWLHGRFLTLSAAKMSKSNGDFIRLQTLRDRHIDPIAYRYLCLTAHYRSNLHFTWESLYAAQAALNRLRHAYARWRQKNALADARFVARFDAEVNEDLNMPNALAVLWDLVKSDLPDATRRASVDSFDAVLGLGLRDWTPLATEIPEDIQALLDERARVRLEGDWAKSDALRTTLQLRGWQVEDGRDGQRVLPFSRNGAE